MRPDHSTSDVRRAADAQSDMSPDQRRRELAHILAFGVLRLRKRQWLACPPAETTRKTTEKPATAGLEVSDETVLSVESG